MNWIGKTVKNSDGRTGSIIGEYEGYLHRVLTIKVDKFDDEEFVQLNSNGKDSGSIGWKWMYSSASKTEAWGTLGDHSDVTAT